MKFLIAMLVLLSVTTAFAGDSKEVCRDKQLDQESILLQKQIAVMDKILALQDILLNGNPSYDEKFKIYDKISARYKESYAIMDALIELKGQVCE